MRNLISAIQFITIIPVGKTIQFNPKGMIPLFPVAGLFIGILLAIFDFIACCLWSGHVAAILDVLFLVIVTGAFHIDGLSDAADGLYGQWPKEKALEIMKDSRVGAMGVVIVICALAVKWGGVSGLDTGRFVLLMVVPAYSRGSMLFGIKFLKYGRPDGGTAHAFFNKSLEFSDFKWLFIPVFLSFFAGLRGVWLNICFVVCLSIILTFYKKRIGCITGDMLGAMTEIMESTLFLMVSIGVIQ